MYQLFLVESKLKAGDTMYLKSGQVLNLPLTFEHNTNLHKVAQIATEAIWLARVASQH